MKYSTDYLEEKYDIYKLDEEVYDVPMTWVYTDDYKHDYIYIFNYDKLKNLKVIENDIIEVFMTDLDTVQVWSLSDYEQDIYLCTDGEYFDEKENKERMINTIANYFKDVPNVVVVFRECQNEEYTEGLIDYLER